ncbi:MAG: hypothetical protein ACKVOH_05720 [Chlamydiales bacterium]
MGRITDAWNAYKTEFGQHPVKGSLKIAGGLLAAGLIASLIYFGVTTHGSYGVDFANKVSAAWQDSCTNRILMTALPAAAAAGGIGAGVTALYYKHKIAHMPKGEGSSP